MIPLIAKIEVNGSYDLALSDQGRIAINPFGAVEVNLPPAVVGLTYSFLVRSASDFQINAHAGDVIHDGPAASSVSGGFIKGNEIAAFLELVCVVNGIWNTTEKRGTWGIDE